MTIEINRIIRDGSFAIALYTENGEVKKKSFPLSENNENIRRILNGESPQSEQEKTIKEKEDPQPKTTEPIEDKRTLKAKYLRELKEKGIDTVGLITFSDVEKVYKKAFSGE